nr:nucleotidyltransferase family protein [Lysobacter daejeonensis]
MGKYGACAGSKRQQSPVGQVQIQGADAHPIAGEEYDLPPRVMHGKRELAIQVLECMFSPVLPCAQDERGVIVGVRVVRRNTQSLGEGSFVPQVCIGHHHTAAGGVAGNATLFGVPWLLGPLHLGQGRMGAHLLRRDGPGSQRKGPLHGRQFVRCHHLAVDVDEAADAAHGRGEVPVSISVMDFSLPVADAGREWLAALIRGGPSLPATPGLGADSLLWLAQEEGVVSLAAERLSAWGSDGDLLAVFSAASRREVALAMLRHAECQQLLAFLRERDVPALLLKGSALAWWLYPAPHQRECSDIDLLLPSRHVVDSLARDLKALGYDLGYTQGTRAYERVCRKALSPSLQLDLDLHWGLNNAPVFADALPTQALWDAAIPLPALAPNARALAPHHALLHACMHRAINLYTGVGDRLKWLYDVHLLALHLQPEEWQVLQTTCRERQLAGVCLSALRAAERWFGPAAPAAVLDELGSLPIGTGVDGARLSDWRYMHRMNLRALPSTWARMDWLVRKLFPETGHLREMYGADRSRMGLWWARVRQLGGRLALSGRRLSR